MGAAVQQNPALAAWALVLLVALVGWFLRRTLQTLDNSINQLTAATLGLFDRVNAISTELSGLQGEHKANHCKR